MSVVAAAVVAAAVVAAVVVAAAAAALWRISRCCTSVASVWGRDRFFKLTVLL